KTVIATGDALDDAWERGKAQLLASTPEARWIRVDWVEQVERQNWKVVRETLNKIKRNYFRLGISLDSDFRHAFLEMELNANAMLYGGPGAATAILNEHNFSIYARKRHGLDRVTFADAAPVWVFATKGV